MVILAIASASSSIKPTETPGLSVCGHTRKVVGTPKERAVVLMVILNGAAELPLTVTVVGETVQLDEEGAPVHDILAEPVNPLIGLTCAFNVAL